MQFRKSYVVPNPKDKRIAPKDKSSIYLHRAMHGFKRPGTVRFTASIKLHHLNHLSRADLRWKLQNS